MDHSYIEEHNIAEYYLLGKLSAQAHTSFEDHLRDCIQCIDLLEVIDGLRLGLQIVAEEENTTQHTAEKLEIINDFVAKE